MSKEKIHGLFYLSSFQCICQIPIHWRQAASKWSYRFFASTVPDWRALCQGIRRITTQGWSLSSPHERGQTVFDVLTISMLYPPCPACEAHGSHLRKSWWKPWVPPHAACLQPECCLLFQTALQTENLVCLFTMSSHIFPNRSQPMDGQSLPPLSVRPTLLQGHLLLQINLSVSEFTNNFNAWFVLWQKKKNSSMKIYVLPAGILHLLIGLAGCDAEPLQISN